MKPRLNPYQVAPNAMKAMQALEGEIARFGLDPSLAELVRIRASQLNGCAFCLDLHTREARARGDSEQRLALLNAWRHSPLFDARERAALAWTEALTLVGEGHVPDDVYQEAHAIFSQEELVKLALLVGAINTWNRIAIAFRSVHPVRSAALAA